MRGCLFHPVIFIVSVLFSRGPTSSAATSVRSPAAHWTVVNQPARLVNGMPVLFRVTTPKPVRALSGNWLGHEIAFSFDASHKSWFALGGASLETKPGGYSIQLRAETSGRQTISFEKKSQVESQR